MMDRQCQSSDNPRLVGDPVDTLSGAVVEHQRDFRLAGHLPLQWWRHYNSSKVNRKFALGWGQTHDFDCCLRFDQDGMHYEAPLGDVTYFPPLLADGHSVAWQGMTLTRINATHFSLSEHGKTTCEFIFSDTRKLAPLSSWVQGNHSISFQYDRDGRLSEIVDSLGTRIEVYTSNDGLLLALSIPKTDKCERRDLLRYEYDRRGNLIAGSDGFGSRFSMEYDAVGRLLRKTDRIGHTFEFQYDGKGRCTRTVGSDGILDNRLEYLPNVEETKVTRGNGGVWRYRYQLGKLAAIVDPMGGQQQFVYDDLGRLAAEIDTNGNFSKIVADAAGATIGKVDPLGHFQAQPVDLNAPNPLHHRVAQNAAEYEFGRLINIEAITTIAAAKPAVESDPGEKNERPSNYFEKANLYSSQNLGFVVGRNWWPEPSSGRQFDATGDLIHQVDRQGRKRRWMYDGNGNVTKYVDFDGGVWKYEYQSWNHLVCETNPIGFANRMEYNSQENITSFVDGGGTRSEYSYDLKDSLIEVRRHGQLRERYERDAAGNLLKKYAADGRLLVELEYGPGNLPVKRSLSSGDTYSYAYDPNGRYLAAETKKDAIAYQYDLFGNRCLEKRNGKGVEHRYRGWRQFGESLWLDNFETRHELAEDGALVITDPMGGKHRVRNLIDGTVERQFSNGTVETIKYDVLGRCESKLVERHGHPRWRREYEWSGEGELRRINDSIRGTSTQTYDAAHRLRSRTLSNGVREEFDFDPANNLLRQPGLNQVTIQSGNRIQNADGESFAYNDRNHISSRTSSNDAIQYFYDSRDQLVRVESGKGVWEAEYDAMGRRARKTFNGLTTEYVWNTDHLAGEISADGKFRLYIYSDALALTPMMFVEYESIKAEPTSGKRFIILSDQIGTPACVEDAGGNVVWEARIEPFGEAKLSHNNRIDFHFRFPGHYWDDDLRLNYNRFRFYDPKLGRYIQSDPIGIAGGDNVYAYPFNPLKDVDPLGLACLTCGGDHPDDPDCEKGPKPKVGPPASQSVKDAAVKDLMARFGMPEAQARVIVEGAMGKGSDIVVGGSRVRGDAKPTSDLDLGYNGLNPNQAGKLNKKIQAVGEKTEGAIPTDPNHPKIVPGNKTPNIPVIQSAEEFFQRSGTRQPPDERAGQPYHPSGSVTYLPDGSIIETSPTGDKTVVRGPTP